MGDLFAEAARERQQENAPLAVRLRPRTLDELVGQQHVLGERSALRLAIEQDRPPSMILFGPPGSGKTTIARIVAERTGAAFEELSAVSARVDDVRAVIARARDRLGGNGLRTILFIDEIHRFNKGQQDSVLHAVEDGLVTLIGATTENPYFEVNAALLSRCTVIELNALSDEELTVVVERGAARARDDGARPSSPSSSRTVRAATRERRSRSSSSPTRRRRPPASRSRRSTSSMPRENGLSCTTARATSTTTSPPRSSSRCAAGTRTRRSTTSPPCSRRARIRASSPAAWSSSPPRTSATPTRTRSSWRSRLRRRSSTSGFPEAQLNLAQAAIYLARAPKSNASAVAIWEARRDVREHGNARPPAMLRSTGHKGAAKARGHGEGYRYPHDDPEGFEVSYLPEELRGRRYYRPAEEDNEEAGRNGGDDG